MIVYIDRRWRIFSFTFLRLPGLYLRKGCMMASRHIGFVMVAAILLSACATRRPVAVIPEAPRSIVPVWKLETGDQITTKIYREPDLAAQTSVSEHGDAYFPGLGRVPVAGLTMDSLQAQLTSRYDKLVIDAAVDAVMMRDVVIYGQVRAPGVYNADPAMTVLGLVAKAGGATGTGKSPVLTLVKGDGRQFRLTREARLSTLDIVHGDAVYVQDESFFGRNATSLNGSTILVSLLVSVLGLFLIVSR
jgi:protein involved in polysaccharide export with SLBB domain